MTLDRAQRPTRDDQPEDVKEQRGWERGAPERGLTRYIVVAVLALTVGMGVGALVLGRSLRSPAQEAAKARAPKASVVTAAVQFEPARTTVVLRATLVDSAAIDVGVPSDLSGSLQVVSATGLAKGNEVSNGSLVAAVAGRPVFVLKGAVPAYANMSIGSTGVNVSELQSDLEALGYGIGSDTAGSYGPGTAAAVAALYTAHAYSPVTSSSTVGESKPAGKGQPTKPIHYATVPRGEVMFVSSLPARLVSIARLGQTIEVNKPLAKIGSGALTMDASTDTNTGSLLLPGAAGRATSDFSKGGFTVRLRSKKNTQGASGPQTRLMFVPVSDAAAAPFVGQNMAIQVSTGQRGGRQWVVPVSAVVTNASGASSITLLKSGRELSVAVSAGLAFQGSEIVTPLHGGLQVGDQVVVGAAGQSGGGETTSGSGSP